MGASTSALGIVRACTPAAVKLVNAFGESRLYKAIQPNIYIIGRVANHPDPSTSDWYDMTQNPDDVAGRYINTYLDWHIVANPDVDAWEGPNEPVISRPEYMRWHGEFSYHFARRLSDTYKRTAVIGNWPVGNPTSSPPDDMALWPHWARGLDAARAFGAIIGLHEYGPLDGDLCLRIRRVNARWDAMGYNWRAIPVFIGEFGPDRFDWLGETPGYINQRYRDGWTPQHLAAYAAAYSDQLPDNVIGAALYTSGTGGDSRWDKFNIDGDGERELWLALMQAAMARGPVRAYPWQAYDGTHIVTAGMLNVRAHPWTGNIEPPIVRRVSMGARVTVLDTVQLQGMTYGWALIDRNGNQWVNARYLSRLT
jgi:hypothetical protein